MFLLLLRFLHNFLIETTSEALQETGPKNHCAKFLAAHCWPFAFIFLELLRIEPSVLQGRQVFGARLHVLIHAAIDCLGVVAALR